MIGWKALVSGRSEAGFCEVAAYSADRRIATVRYYTGPSEFVTAEVPTSELDRTKPIAEQSRFSTEKGGAILLGSVLRALEVKGSDYRSYWVRLPNQPIRQFREDEFHVISYLGHSDPVATLGHFGHETPFFAEKRWPLVENLIWHRSLCRGLTALASSRIEFFPHQVEIARRVLSDPVIRYLLADEVGLGKTIEAGIILKQLEIDKPSLKSAVFVPSVLQRQWEDELRDKFQVDEVEVLTHLDLSNALHENWDIVIVDEVHRLVAGPNVGSEDYDNLRLLASRSPHLLLLSATPVLYHDADLLALLHLLDPRSFNLNDLPSFQRLLSIRQTIGRTLLSLESVRLPALVRAQVARVANLLPQDPIVQQIAAEVRVDVGSGEAVKRLRSHLADTYCIHRRMVRTRRKYLEEELGVGAGRIEQPVEYELDEDWRSRLWQLLEEWRIEATGQVRDEQIHELQEAYLLIGEVLAARVDELKRTINGLPRHIRRVGERIFERMFRELTQAESGSDRVALVLEMLGDQYRREHGASKRVVFCSDTATCRQLTERLSQQLGAQSVESACSGDSVEECEERIERFRNDRHCWVLVCDSILEEGRNLQFADSLLLYDIPWSPMKIEQRIGRLDRIDRVDPVRIKSILTLDDGELALDAAWYRILRDGFGIFEASMSDLQLVIESELPRLRGLAFQGGPALLLAEIPSLRERVESERQKLEEQDVIDGLRLDQVQSTAMWKDLQTMEEHAHVLSSSIEDYLHAGLCMGSRRFHEGKSFSFYIAKNQEPLIPQDRLLPIIRYRDREMTWWRPRAVHEPTIELVRVGHPLTESLHQLVMWDERGRAYAMWRRAAGISDPHMIFRICLGVEADLSAVEKEIGLASFDGVSRCCLLRLIRGWFPSEVLQVFLDSEGGVADTTLAERCMQPYDRRLDINLGGERTSILKEYSGLSWESFCADIGRKSRDTVAKSSSLLKAISEAESAAKLHFKRLEDQLKARLTARVDALGSLQHVSDEISRLSHLVALAIARPAIRIDTIGVYILSENPPCKA